MTQYRYVLLLDSTTELLQVSFTCFKSVFGIVETMSVFLFSGFNGRAGSINALIRGQDSFLYRSNIQN